MATLLGIDVGSHSVKLALMEGRLGRVDLSEFRQRRVRAEDGGRPTLDDRIRALNLLLAETAEAGVQVVGMPTEKVSVRSVEMPFADPTQIDRTLAFELEGHVPFDLDEFVLDYRISRAGRGARLTSEGKSLVLCGLAQEDTVREWLEAVESAGADPRQAVLDAEMLGYLADDDKVQLVLDLGHERTLLAFCARGEILDVAAVEQGGSALTRGLMSAFAWSEEEAESQKHSATVNPLDLSELGSDREETSEGEGTSTPTEIARTISRSLEPLVAQIRTRLFSFEGRHGLEVEEVLLTGGGAHLGGIAGVLSRGLSVPARMSSISDEARAEGDGGRFAVAHGLALRAAGMKGSAAFDFRKGGLAHAGSLALGRNLLRYGLVAMLFFAVGGGILFGMKRSALSSEMGEIEAKIVELVAAQFPDLPPSALEGDNKAFSTLLTVAGEVGERVSILESTVAGEPATLSLLKEISEAMPAPGDARVEVTNLTITEKSVVIKAKTTGFEAASTIEQALQDNERFKEATRGDEKKQRNGLTFSITIPMESDKKEEG